ncbi:MAG: glycoside hydrolase N-terminal domain-containing protein [Candidatus Latescibacterota bacterium]|jgi:hypothetical protein
MSNKELFYNAPATEYMSGLPIGTGRLAAMVSGSLPERVALNHEWLWRGCQRQREPDKNAHRLEEVRQLLRARQWAEGTLVGQRALWRPWWHQRRAQPRGSLPARR